MVAEVDPRYTARDEPNDVGIFTAAMTVPFTFAVTTVPLLRLLNDCWVPELLNAEDPVTSCVIPVGHIASTIPDEYV